MNAAIVDWNSTYPADAIEHLHQQQHSIPVELLAQMSPLFWEHIGFSGGFLWDQAAATAGQRRPLNFQAGKHGSMTRMFTKRSILALSGEQPTPCPLQLSHRQSRLRAATFRSVRRKWRLRRSHTAVPDRSAKPLAAA